MQTITLDCAPGGTRPWHLIHAVIEGTGLTLSRPETDEDHSFCFFGSAEFEFDVDRAEWVERIQPIIRPRIQELFERGVIRFGGW